MWIQSTQVKTVGDKTFVWHEEAWIDTTFDGDRMTASRIGFGSDDYFELLAARPEWGRYFALGRRVIVVLDGTAYEVVEGEGDPVEVPPAATPIVTPEPTSDSEPEAVTVTVADDPDVDVGTTRESSPVCGGVLSAALLPLVGLVLARRR